MKFMGRLKRILMRELTRNADIGYLEILDDGFRFLRADEEIAKLQWSEIKEVTAFKRDLLTTDLVCFEVMTTKGLLYEFNEDVPGFELWVSEMQRTLLGFDSSWRDRVISPPFAPNRTAIFHNDK